MAGVAGADILPPRPDFAQGFDAADLRKQKHQSLRDTIIFSEDGHRFVLNRHSKLFIAKSFLRLRLLRAGQLVSDYAAPGFRDQGHPAFLCDQGGNEFILAVVVKITHVKILDVA